MRRSSSFQSHVQTLSFPNIEARTEKPHNAMAVPSQESQGSQDKELLGGRREDQESDEESSPRGVLEVAISGSDSENCSRSSSFGSSPPDKPAAGHHGLHWRSLIGSVRWKMSLRRKPDSFRIADDGEIDAGDVVAPVPKPSWRNFTHQELAAATDNFSSEKLIGKGGHAEVYKGCFPDGQIVAVKRVTKKEKKDEDRVGDFLSELGIIAHINHPNAAKLIGFSSDGGFHLVLQFSPHGSLSSVLHGGKEILDWETRFKVALGVANGLRYLHCECQRRIIHRDIKASNILLTQDYDPQISDFGLAKWLPQNWAHHVVYPIEGTFGYMAPEYFMHGIVNEKTDVFAFGVLLLELITGRRAVDSCQQSLVMWAKPLLEKNSVKEIADGGLGEAYDAGEMKRAMLTASACLHHLPSLRPGMNRVVELLTGEGGGAEPREKAAGGRTVILDACDMEDYSSTAYLNDLHRHRQLVLE